MRPDILTASGHYFNFVRPDLCLFTVEDIAHGLSNVCRFGGQCREFYGVAQHAVYTSYLVPPELAMQALHHDDAEAFIGDVSSPLKRLLPDYKVIERRVEDAVWMMLGLPNTLAPEVKHADIRMLATEKRDLMSQCRGAPIVSFGDDGEASVVPLPMDRDDPWALIEGVMPAPLPIRPVGPVEARAMYLARHRELLGIKRD